ncbi:MAG TPA: RNA polymerase sigma-70 factor [Candidatus Babeliaceae bacterium]|nr:RNA polymerase sigma-70 factor [Candidatus Babeliaceae bacterium]
MIPNSTYSERIDSELFQLIKQNDTKSFEELYNRYWSALVNFANKRLDSKEKSEDIVQNIFIDIYQRRASIQLNISLKAYLFQALKFKILNLYRAETISNKYKKSLFFNPICKNDLAEELEAKELELIIDRTISHLPEKCRQVFVLSRKENLSNKDISNRLNISVSTVEKHITKALKTLQETVT